MADLVPLKVKIGLKTTGSGMQHDYPDFNRVPAAKRDDMDWSLFFDKVNGGIGWHYDKKCGHCEKDETSELGEWYGCTLVPQDFASEALIRFGPTGSIRPGLVTQLTEVEFEKFYDERAHAHEEAIRTDMAVLEAMAARDVLAIARTAEDAKALDPDDPTPGVIRNKHKTWVLHKAATGQEIVVGLRKG